MFLKNMRYRLRKANSDKYECFTWNICGEQNRTHRKEKERSEERPKETLKEDQRKTKGRPKEEPKEGPKEGPKRNAKRKDQIKGKGYSEKITIKIIMFHVKHQWTTRRKIEKRV